MNKCKICGNLAPDGFTLCDTHFLERCKTDTEKNMFLGGKFYERRNMREKIMEYLKELSGNWDAYVVGNPLTEITTYDEATNQILNLISEEIEKVENPYESDGSGFNPNTHRKVGFEDCKYKILNLLRPKENVVGNAEL